jgi:predicted nucleic acid-binding protein
MEFTVAAQTVETFVRALELSARHGLAFWDATIVAAAHGSNCAMVYSEDFDQSQDYSGVRVINPFRLG